MIEVDDMDANAALSPLLPFSLCTVILNLMKNVQSEME